MRIFTHFLIFTLLGTVLSCHRKEAVPEVTNTSANASQDVLAHLEEFKPQVIYRRSAELVWQEAKAVGLPLSRFDAVQTQSAAQAEIAFVNGSHMKLNENTLVIINPRDLKSLSGIDRATLRGGKLTGQTQKELWLVTSAALFKLKSENAQKIAQANLSLEEGKKLRIEVKEGKGSLIKTNSSKKNEEIDLFPGKVVELPAPIPDKLFGWETPKTEPVTKPRVAKTPRKPPTQTPSESPPKTVVWDLIITHPANHSEIKDPQTVLSGKATAPGLTIIINGQKVAQNENQEFSLPLALQKGANVVSIQLIKPDGTSAFKRWTVIRKE